MDMVLELAMGSHEENPTDDNLNSVDEALNSEPSTLGTILIN